MPNVNKKKMKSALLYLDTRSRGPTSRCCRIVHAKKLALTGAIYTLVSQIEKKVNMNRNVMYYFPPPLRTLIPLQLNFRFSTSAQINIFYLYVKHWNNSATEMLVKNCEIELVSIFFCYFLKNFACFSLTLSISNE